MDVLTTQWGWIGGKKQGFVPPTPTPPTRAFIRIDDFQLFGIGLDNDLTNNLNLFDQALYSITVSDEV